MLQQLQQLVATLLSFIPEGIYQVIKSLKNAFFLPLNGF